MTRLNGERARQILTPTECLTVPLEQRDPRERCRCCRGGGRRWKTCARVVWIVGLLDSYAGLPFTETSFATLLVVGLIAWVLRFGEASADSQGMAGVVDSHLSSGETAGEALQRPAGTQDRTPAVLSWKVLGALTSDCDLGDLAERYAAWERRGSWLRARVRIYWELAGLILASQRATPGRRIRRTRVKW